MGVSVSARNRARGVRARFLGPGFVPTDFGQRLLWEPEAVPSRAMTRSDVRRSDELSKLHATAQAAAHDARGMERLMERKRWSNG